MISSSQHTVVCLSNHVLNPRTVSVWVQDNSCTYATHIYSSRGPVPMFHFPYNAQHYNLVQATNPSSTVVLLVSLSMSDIHYLWRTPLFIHIPTTRAQQEISAKFVAQLPGNLGILSTPSVCPGDDHLPMTTMLCLTLLGQYATNAILVQNFTKIFTASPVHKISSSTKFSLKVWKILDFLSQWLSGLHWYSLRLYCLPILLVYCVIWPIHQISS